MRIREVPMGVACLVLLAGCWGAVADDLGAMRSEAGDWLNSCTHCEASAGRKPQLSASTSQLSHASGVTVAQSV